MKILDQFKLREIAGEHILVHQGTLGVNFTKVISLNESACFLFEAFLGKDFCVEDVAAALVAHYGIDSALAATDAAKWVEALINCGVIE